MVVTASDLKKTKNIQFNLEFVAFLEQILTRGRYTVVSNPSAYKAFFHGFQDPAQSTN